MTLASSVDKLGMRLKCSQRADPHGELVAVRRAHREAMGKIGFQQPFRETKMQLWTARNFYEGIRAIIVGNGQVQEGLLSRPRWTPQNRLQRLQ
jgi:hypothetical protein